MQPYTITLTGKHKEILFKETVLADNKNEAWEIIHDRLIDAMDVMGNGEIEIKEG